MRKTETKPTISIRIDIGQLKKIDELARTSGLSRSNIINQSIKKYIEESELGESKYTKLDESIEYIITRLNMLEKNVRTTSSRINIIARQIDSTQKRFNLFEKRWK